MRIRRRALYTAVAVLGALAPASASAATGPATAYVQAVVVAADPARGSLDYVDPSGRPQRASVTASVLPRLSRLRPGDQVLLVIGGVSRRPLVTGLRAWALVGQPEPAVDPTILPPRSHSGRPSWPNPFSRLNPPDPDARNRTPRRAGAL